MPKKTVGNDLYALQKKHHILSSKVISYLQECFSYTIKQHKNDLVFTKASAQNIVPHCFGDREKCNEKWCSGKFEASYKHKSLPYGRDLCGEKLKKDLNRFFEKHAKNADALSPNGSTCANESFNLLVASKAPKMHHYPKSKSLKFCIASAVCQKNIGQTPWRISHKFSLQQEKVKLKKKEKSLSIQFNSKKDVCSWKKAEGVQVVSNS